jgi:hypothetical protein
MQSLDLTYKEIYPKIFVYNKLLPDAKHLHETMKLSEEKSVGKYFYSEWTDWFIFGKYCHSKSIQSIIEGLKKSDKDGNEYDFDLFAKEYNLHHRLNEAVTAAISNYIAINDINLPENSYISDQNIGRYDPGVDTGEGKTMQYHTDYGIGEWYWPGEKFLLTATTYVNDDYDGGEIMFSIGDDIIRYKPEAGDILVFPSGSPLYPGKEPYFHGVDGIQKSSKFLVRMYLKYVAKGEKKWYDGEEKYGKDEWYKIAKERAEGHNTIAVFDGQLKLCSALITQLYGIDPSTYEAKTNVYYDEDKE